MRKIIGILNKQVNIGHERHMKLWEVLFFILTFFWGVILVEIIDFIVVTFLLD